MKKVLLQFTLVSVLVFCFAVPVVDAARVKTPPSTSPGLVGWWTFDGTDATSGKMIDRSGSGNTGTFNNIASSTFYAAGKIGQAGNFDGSNDSISISSASSLDLTRWTISAWIKLDGLGARRVIVAKVAVAGDPNSDNYELEVTSANKISAYFERTDGDNTNLVTAASVDMEWTHVVYSFDEATDSEVIYINGAVAATQTNTRLPETADASTVYIGRDVVNSVGPFLGKLDDVRVYNRALTSDEVGQLYRIGFVTRKTVSNSGLVGYWSFNEGTSTSVGDGSGNGNTGTLTNMDSATDWVPGKLGKALDFDGSNDHIVISDSNTIDIGQGASATLAVWYYSQNDTAERIIYSKRSSDSSTATDYMLFTTGNQLVFGTGSSADSCAWQAVSEPSKNEWHHIVGILSSTGSQSGTKRLYIDGVLVDSCTYSIKTVSNSSSLYIGRPVANSSYWRGKIDDFRIYNRALSAAEVATLYRSNETRVAASKNNFLTEGLVGMWSFDGRDMNYTSVYDRSGRGNDLLTLNIATSSRVPGKLGQALSFDGSSSYVYKSTPPAGFPTGNSPISYSLWVKPPAISTPRVIFFYGANSASMSYYIDVARCAANSFSAGKWGSTLHCDSTPYTPGEWYHLVLVSDGTTSRFYKNGTLVSSIATTLNLSASYMEIGRYSGGEYFNGTIDDVRVYNRALSASEAQLLYNSGR